MAKLSARHQWAVLRATRPHYEDRVLRSDGAVLRRKPGGGYTVIARRFVDPATQVTPSNPSIGFARHYEAKGFRVEREGPDAPKWSQPLTTSAA